MKLTFFAHRRFGRRSIDTAKEVVQEALTRIWDPEYKDWDPLKEPDLLAHLGSVVNGIVSNIWKAASTKSERSASPDQLARHAPRGATTDGRAADAKIDAEGFLYHLLERVADDVMVTDMICLMSEGVDKPAEQALHLKCARNEIYNANRRLADHVASLQATLRKENHHGL